MKDGDIPRGISLNSLDLWVQIHDLRAGFMTEKIVKEVGNYIGTFVESCSKNFTGAWKEYLRVRVTINLAKPLKRRMKIRKAGDGWEWIMFNSENVPTFYFICGLIGHSEKFCSLLFDNPEAEMAKPYGVWMRAPFRRQTKLIGVKWLRDGSTKNDRRNTTREENSSEREDNSVARNQGLDPTGDNHGGQSDHIYDTGAKSANSKSKDLSVQANKSTPDVTETLIIENKKRKTGNGLNPNIELGNEMDVGLTDQMDQDQINISASQTVSKNGEKADSVTGVCLGQ